MTEPPSPLETALDLLVYAPVGLGMTLSEEIPRLAAKGRSRIEGQVATARLIGRFAVGQGRQMMAGAARPAAPSPGAAGPSGAGSAGPGVGRPRPSSRRAPGTTGPKLVSSGGEVPAVATLAIPGYDSLSASQVVQRLAGLLPDELDAVARYEAGHRGRRTVLARVMQLQQR